MKKPPSRAAVAALLGVVLSVAACCETFALAPRPYEAPGVSFTPFVAPTSTPKPTQTPRPSPRPERTQKPERRSTPKPEVSKPSGRAGNSISGKASWYCKAGVSICHYAYPPGSMVAAACGKLRRAMGRGWRGEVVRVTRRDTGRSVTVTLVDWCGSETKLIDLYWKPMNLLGGTGVLRVTVRW